MFSSLIALDGHVLVLVLILDVLTPIFYMSTYHHFNLNLRTNLTKPKN
jgi:hypothetical protein